MGDIRKKIKHSFKKMKKYSRTLKWIWILSLFLSPFIGIISIVVLLNIEIYNSIDWNTFFYKIFFSKFSN